MARASRIATLTLVAMAMAGCGDDGGASGGTGGSADVMPGLWVGSFDGPGSDGWDLCMYVGPSGDVIQAAVSCSLNDGAPFSIELDVRNAGTDPNQQPCSFDVRIRDAVPIRSDGSFSFENDDGVITARIEGEFVADTASGTARASDVPVIESCSLGGWTAAPSNPE